MFNIVWIEGSRLKAERIRWEDAVRRKIGALKEQGVRIILVDGIAVK